MNVTPREEVIPLTPQAFYIMLALAEKPMYGYGVFQQCVLDANNEVYFDKGSIYRTMHRLTQFGYISSAFEMTGRGSAHSRKYYELTGTGRKVLAFECDRYRQASIIGQHRLRKLKDRGTLNV